MRNLHFVFILLAGLLSSAVSGQNKFTLSGTITDSETGEALIGANVYITSLKGGTSTNTYGFFSITIPSADTLGTVISYVGYTAQIKKINFNQDIEMDIRMAPSASALDEIVIEGSRIEQEYESTQMGVINVPLDKIMELPVILAKLMYSKLFNCFLVYNQAMKVPLVSLYGVVMLTKT